MPIVGLQQTQVDSKTLTSYLLAVRRLLKDAKSQYYDDATLIDYINDARVKVASDTACLRNRIQFRTVVGQDLYPLANIPHGQRILGVMGITLVNGSVRAPLFNRPYNSLNVTARPWVGFQGPPSIWSRYGEQSFVLGPTPDQVYPLEIDACLMPDMMVSTATDANGNPLYPESIPVPYTMLVPFYAAHVAKMYEQSMDDSGRFEQMYFRKLKEFRGSIALRSVADPYAGQAI